LTRTSWQSLSYASAGRSADAERHRRLLTEIATLSAASESQYSYGYSYGHQQMIYLDEFKSRRIWDLLAEADEIGLPLVQAGKLAGPVIVGPRPGRVSER